MTSIETRTPLKCHQTGQVQIYLLTVVSYFDSFRLTRKIKNGLSSTEQYSFALSFVNTDEYFVKHFFRKLTDFICNNYGGTVLPKFKKIYFEGT